MSTTTAAPSRSVAATSSVNTLSTPADKGLLIIRIAAAIVFLYHGSAILFGAFGGPGLHVFAGYVGGSAAVAALVGLAQLCGGLAMLTGVFARIGAACLVAVMLGAILLVHLPHGFSIANNGMEYAFTQLCVALAVLIDGPGAYSLATALPASLRRL